MALFAVHLKPRPELSRLLGVSTWTQSTSVLQELCDMVRASYSSFIF